MSSTNNAPRAKTGDLDETAGVVAYAAAVAARQPTPGGGSVVGVVAALAAALGSMVCRFTPALSDTEDSAGPPPTLAELDRWRDELLSLANADAAAYAAYRAAYALPKQTEDDRAQRRAAMQAALVTATDVPLAIARGCARLRNLLAAVAETGNPHLRFDAEIGALLAVAALRGSLINVRGNVALLKDATVSERYRADAEELERSVAADSSGLKPSS